MPRRLNTTTTERAGVNYVAALVESQGSLFHEIDGRNDYGNDGIIQLVRSSGEVLPAYVMVQIKSGRSYVTANGCTLVADREHFRFWADHTTLVAGIVFDPDEQAAYWIDVGRFLADYPDRCHNGPFSIPIEKARSTRLDVAGWHTFFDWAIRQQAPKLDRAVEALHSENASEHAFGAYVLSTAFGCSAAAWDALFYAFEHRRSLSPSLVVAISMLGDHPDIFWRPGMVVSNDQLRCRLRARLVDLPYAVVRKLVEAIDENGIDRGTIGQCVDVVLHEHSAPGPHFARLLKEAEDPWTLECAAFLYAHLDPSGAGPVLAEVAGTNEIFRMLAEAVAAGDAISLY